MGKTMLILAAAASMLLLVGCASSPDAAGQAMSGVLMGIGQGLSGL